MTPSPQERSAKINDFTKIVQAKGFDYLINNHASDITQIQVTDAEWFQLAREDKILKAKVSQLNFDENGHATLDKPQSSKTVKSEWNIYKARPIPHPEILEKDGSGVLYLGDAVFQNWDKSISHLNSYIFYPRSKEAIQNIIRWAKDNVPDMEIRATGYGHSSSNIFGDNNQILISMLDYETANHLPAKHPGMDPDNDLQGIKIVGEIEENGEKKALCKLGSATCNYHFRRWVHDPNGGNLQWALPANVVMTEITVGGDIIPICHGGGPKTKTLSDLVTELEYIDVNGNIQVVKDPQEIKAAAGSFGVQGIITSVTMKLDKMTYANLNTMEKANVFAAIPPVSYQEVPLAIRPYYSKEEYEQCCRDFENHILNDYYNEWFWFPIDVDDPFTENTWVNCWKNDADPENAVRFPPVPKLIEAGTYLGDLANMTFFKSGILSGKQQANLFGKLTLATLPNHPSTICTLEDAEHFRNDGIQNIREVMVEFEVGIPPRKDDPNRPDLTAIRKMWYDVINEVRATQDEFPLRTTMEMRVMGGSDIIMAPQNGNKWTAAIEILTPPQVKEEVWDAFVQKVLDKWTQHKNADGTAVKILPHWAKGFGKLSMHGVPIWDYLKHVYKDKIAEFNVEMKKMANEGHYSFVEMQKRFSNSTLRQFFWESEGTNYFNNKKWPQDNKKDEEESQNTIAEAQAIQLKP